MTDSGARIFRMSDVPTVDRGQGIRSIPYAGKESGSQTLLQGITCFPPGASIALHTHSSDECVVVLQGEAVCEIDGTLHPMKAFDATFAPAGVPHRFINAGSTEMRILWTYSAVETSRTFVESGETMSHLETYH